MRPLGPLAIAATLAAGSALAGEEAAPPAPVPGAGSGSGPAQEAAAPAPPAEAGKKWALEGFLYGYLLPDDQDYVQPTVTADRGRLHLEARLNYEDMDTVSVWAGYNWSLGEKVTFDLTLMAGGIFGDTDGVAPGYRGTLGWKKLELYSEGEYVFDAGGKSDSFFYTWSELTLSPVEWFRVGVAAQRTRVYESDAEIERGLLAGFTWRQADFSASVLNLDESRPTVVLGLGLSF